MWKKILKFFSEMNTVSVSHTYFYNGKKVDKLPPEAEEQLKHMNRAFEHMDEAFKEVDRMFK